MHKKYRTVLTIANSDSGGGSGLQADIKTISSLGCYATSVITAITAQNTIGISAIHPVPVDIIEKQVTAVLQDIGAHAIKIGMLYSTEIVKTVHKILKKYLPQNIVFDPAIIDTNGNIQQEEKMIKTLKNELIPDTDIFTPNLHEAEILLNKKINNVDEMIDSAKELLEFGCQAVLIKGGHIKSEIVYDVYTDAIKQNVLIFRNKKINTNNTNGASCTLSSAIASYLALGNSLPKAVKYANRYTHEAIKHGKEFKIGKGKGPVNHFFNQVN